MGKNITVKEGGTARGLTAKKLKTAAEGGGSILWVPKDERRVKSIRITENGVYNAADEGYYGYDEVIVDVQGGTTTDITGRDPDGNEYHYHSDGHGGITKEKVPSEIRVIEPPTNPYGIYVDGQTIVKDGMVVKAYDGNGNEMQTVPLGEVTINPTTAVYDPTKDRQEYSDGEGINATYFASTGVHPQGDELFYIVYEGFVITSPNAEFLLTKYDGEVYAVSANGNVYNYSYTVYYDHRSTSGNMTAGQNFLAAANNDFWGVAESSVNPLGHRYDELSPKGRAGSHQTITVSWPRPGDGKILNATFEILVGPSPSGDDDR